LPTITEDPQRRLVAARLPEPQRCGAEVAQSELGAIKRLLFSI
jgi:hypothetical protein